MSALFVLLRDGADHGELLALLEAAGSEVTVRRYPRASDARHLFSLVRDGRDRHATRWLRGLLLAMIGGAVIGGIVNGVLAVGFDMFGGMASIAVPLGLLLGTFLGAFTALMTGTHVAREGLRPLLQQAKAGDILLQVVANDRVALSPLAGCCERSSVRFAQS